MSKTPSFPGVTGLATTTDARKAFAGLVETDTSGNARSGIFPAHANALVTARADMNLDVAAYQACGVQFGGPVFFTNDGTTQLDAVLVSPAAGNNFYVVYAKQNESTAPGTDANTNRVLSATLSAASFAAARALLPTGAVELATVLMPTGKTGTNNAGVTITQTFQYTASEGGVVWLRNATEEAAWSPADGALAWRMDAGAYRQRRGGAWAPLNQVDVSGLLAGSAYDGVSPLIYKMGTVVGTTNASAIVAINWPGGAFPNGLMGAQLTPGDAAASMKMVISSTSITTSQLVAQCLTGANTGVVSAAVRINFLAVGW